MGSAFDGGVVSSEAAASPNPELRPCTRQRRQLLVQATRIIKHLQNILNYFERFPM